MNTGDAGAGGAPEVQEGDALSRDASCFAKAQERGDYTFTLVGQDLSSPAVICEWIKQNIETAPPAKLREALDSALLMRGGLGRKHAD